MSKRYSVGCAGMFVLGTATETDDINEAIALCEWPPGCEVIDRMTGETFGPASQREIDDAKVAVASSRAEAER